MPQTGPFGYRLSVLLSDAAGNEFVLNRRASGFGYFELGYRNILFSHSRSTAWPKAWGFYCVAIDNTIKLAALSSPC